MKSIEQLEAEYAAAETAWRAAREAEAEKKDAMYREQIEYSIKLQRLIERFCRGDPLPYPELHHSQMLAKQIPKDDGKYAESMRWGAREPR